MTTIVRRISMSVIGLVLMAGHGQASLITYVGEDIQPFSGPAVRTNSDAAAASFRSAALSLGSVGTITFESAPLGSFTNLTVALGVSMNGIDINSNPHTIRNTTGFPPSPTLDGSNTTAGGSRFVEMIGGTLTFTFAQPTQFFGVYLTGVQTAFFHDTVTFSDGTTQSISLVGAGTSSSVGEIAFIGFTDAGRSISSITIVASNANGADAIGVDDVSYQVVVPEPSSLALCGIAGIVALGRTRLRRRA